MRALRTSVWGSPNDPPLTVIARQCDVSIPVEEVAPEHWEVGFFLISDIFDVPDDTSLERATYLGAERASQRQREERDMAMAYFWYVTILRRINAGGTMQAAEAAPLSRADLEVVLRQVASHPNYRSQRIIMLDADGAEVTLEDGKIDA